MTVSINGELHQLDAAGFGNFIKQNYDTLEFIWQKQFRDYKDTHIMRDVLNTLMSGMDNVSCYYITHHEALLGATPLGNQVIFHNNVLWNEIDVKLKQRYEELKSSGIHPILSLVNQEWGTSITNFYGLYDTDVAVLQQINGKAILDVGAFIGDSASVFRTLFPQSTIYAFEPSKFNTEQMYKHFAKDIDAGIIKPVLKGCGDKKATLKLCKFQGDLDSRASMHFNNDDMPFEEVEVIRIDDYVAENNIDVGLIKMDIEGFEIEAIKGALEVIKTKRPLLVISIYHTPEEFYELKPFLENLHLNYEFRVRRASLQNPLKELVLIGIPR